MALALSLLLRSLSHARARLVLPLLVLSAVSGCSPAAVAVGGGATAGVAASEERGIDGALSDSQIAAQINYDWLQNSVDMFHALNLAVYEGRVMITGVLPKETEADEAVALAWKPKGVREVINEIVIDPSGTTGSFATDTWITAQLKAKLLFDKDVSAVNYSVDTVRGVVYIMGVAQSKAEIDRVIGYARNIEYVKKVVNHAILKSDARRKS